MALSYRFAEGDTSILRQKMARDSLKSASSGGPLALVKELLRAPLHLVQNKGGLGWYECSPRVAQLFTELGRELATSLQPLDTS